MEEKNLGSKINIEEKKEKNSPIQQIPRSSHAHQALIMSNDMKKKLSWSSREEVEEKYSSRCRNLTRWTYDLNKISINASREAERVTALKSNRSPALLASCSI